MAVFVPETSSDSELNERLLFQEFIKKRTPFFLIVFKSDCSEEEVQEAYLSVREPLPRRRTSLPRD
jgi:hypothetical protein